MYQLYQNIMDSDRNSLRSLPQAQRLQAMILLSVMWSTIFCLSTNAWFWYSELVVGHVLVIFGIAITALTFSSASEKEKFAVASKKEDALQR
jgi:hypothetical protein